LEFLSKAQKLGVNYTIVQNDDGYSINLFYDWYDTLVWRNNTVFITNEGESTWEKGDHKFDTMNKILDEKLEGQRQNEEKEHKRKALLERLTAEERELLGV
jgi:hypothetical protein